MRLISVMFVVLLGFPAMAAEIEADVARLQAKLDTLSAYGGTDDGGLNRPAYSDADKAARAYMIAEMEALGLDVTIDAGANIIGRRAGTEAGLKPIMVGSHIDSVPFGGRYDGNTGVLAQMEMIALMNDHDITTRHPVEVVIFQNEEGGLYGSLVMSGHLKPEALSQVASSGKTIGEGITFLGGDVTALETAKRAPGSLAAFIELHIEQGAFLDEQDIDIGVVQGIVGIKWWDVTITGVANHGGTTPMRRRQDALLAASHYVDLVNRTALRMAGRQVATVGRLQAHPGAPNVIPGRVDASLEIRDLETAKIDAVFAAIQAGIPAIEAATGTSFDFRYVSAANEPALTDPRMRDIIRASAKARGYSTLDMPSGAGHDAQDMVDLGPTGMIFVPSKDGISHAPEEFTKTEDIAKGVNVLLDTVLAIDGQMDQ